jgi:hypothetical protein
VALGEFECEAAPAGEEEVGQRRRHDEQHVGAYAQRQASQVAVQDRAVVGLHAMSHHQPAR